MSHASETESIAKLDALTKLGQRKAVLSEIEKIRQSQTSRALLPQLARIANRNHASMLALRLLHPMINDDRNQIFPASDEVLGVYAKSLLSVGALEEASECLNRLQTVTAESLLTQAFIHFAQWDYQRALPVLRKYILFPSQSEYQVLVGKINLLAANIVVGNLTQAAKMSDGLIESLEQRPDYQLLYGNCLELRAQIHICNQSYEEALNSLIASENVLKNQPGRYLLYVKKWRAIARLGISTKDDEARELLTSVKMEARELKNWETLRDCDFHLARFDENETQLQRLLLGTPYRGFHERTERIFGIQSIGSRSFEYCPHDPMTDPKQIGLDMKGDLNYSFLSSTSWPLLKAITHDIYRPPRASAIFSQLYKDQYFDPFTSPQRVRNAVFRFNSWAEKENNPFRIRVQNGEFSLSALEGTSIACTRTIRSQTAGEATLQAFRRLNDSRSFTCAQLAKFIGVTSPTALKIIQNGVASKKIRKLGEGKNSRYIFRSRRK